MSDYTKEKDRIVLLLDAIEKPLGQKYIAHYCWEKAEEFHALGEPTLIKYFIDFKNNEFRSGKSEYERKPFAYDKLIQLLTELFYESLRQSYNGTIVFSYWSEGSEDSRDEDRLKNAFLFINLNHLGSDKQNDCTLVYLDDDLNLKDILHGRYRQKPKSDSVLIFHFDNGTTIITPYHKTDYRVLIFKGTYISTPHRNFACGIGIFQFFEGIELKEIFSESRKLESTTLSAELYKKRLLTIKGIFDEEDSFSSKKLVNELTDLGNYFIRYRASSTNGCIHGDLIKLEPFGKVIYKGSEKAIKNGRCFVQERGEKYPKNLLIELFQEPDIKKKGFENRMPHSFMMFDISDPSPIFVGALLKPNNIHQINNALCYLIKVVQNQGANILTEQNFSTGEFLFDGISSDEIFNRVKHYHILPGCESQIRETFQALNIHRGSIIEKNKSLKPVK